MTIDFIFNSEFYISLIVAVVAAIVGLLIARYFFSVPFKAKINSASLSNDYKDDERKEGDNDEPVAADSQKYPGLTVVVYAFCRWETLDEYVESLMRQDYPNFKVVLVCDATSAATTELTENFAIRWPGRFYATFIPPGSHNLSRRKLALTLGLKAADTEYVVTTGSNCRINSDSWLSTMMQPIIEDAGKTEIVLGCSTMDFKEFRGAGKWYRQMIDTLRSCQWLSAALQGAPFRGDGYNLLYKRSLFFERKGYGDTISLEHGDDDIFITSIATERNTAVVIADAAILTTEWGDASRRIWSQRKQRYDFTRRWLPQKPFIISGLFSMMQWAVFAACVSAAFFSMSNILGAAIALVVWGIFVLTEIALYRRVARALHSTALWWSLPWFLLWRPVGNFLFRLSHHSTRNKNFTHRRN